MIFIIIALSVFNVVLITSLSYLIYKIYQLGKIVLELEDQIEESLDSIDDLYRRISMLLEIPVIHDEPVVRQLIDIMKDTRETLLIIANKIITFTHSDTEDDNEKE